MTLDLKLDIYGVTKTQSCHWDFKGCLEILYAVEIAKYKGKIN